jgi:hypothetical protein
MSETASPLAPITSSIWSSVSDLFDEADRVAGTGLREVVFMVRVVVQ